MKHAGCIDDTETSYMSKDQEKLDSSCHHPFNLNRAFRREFIPESSKYQLAVPNEVVKDDKQAHVDGSDRF